VQQLEKIVGTLSSVPKSANRYSIRPTQFGANAYSIPPPAVQPVRVFSNVSETPRFRFALADYLGRAMHGVAFEQRVREFDDFPHKPEKKS
jgi:hypothetical protein